MSKTTLWIGASLCWFSFAANAGELLGHISEDTAQPLSDAKPSQTDDRRIIYRVICAPGDEQLPDCEKPVTDHESIEIAKPIAPKAATHDSDIEQTQKLEDASEAVQAVKPSPAKSKKSTGKKIKANKKSKTLQKTSSKSSKKSTVKKSSAKNKRH